MITIAMNASISDIFEEMGEWTPENGYEGMSSYERLQALSKASDEADEAYAKAYKEADNHLRALGRAMEENYYENAAAFFEFYREEYYYLTPEDYMPEGYTRRDYIPQDERI